MDDKLQLICIIAVGVEFLLLLLAAGFLFSEKNNALRKIFGAFGCVFCCLFLITTGVGIAHMFGFDLGFLGDGFYALYDYMLVWAIIAFGAAISIFAIVSGFKRVKKEKQIATQVAETDFKDDVDELPIGRESGDVFKGLQSELDIESFLGELKLGENEEIKEKRNGLKKLEKLLK